jgi:hypothetical protein
MRSTITTLLAVVALTTALAATAMAAPPADLHCPAGWSSKDESGADDNDLVYPAGTTICVKAGTENTGIIVANGWSTLQDYLVLAGIMDGSGEQGRDVSYHVMYGLASPTPSPTPESSVAPTPEPSLPDSAIGVQVMPDVDPAVLTVLGLLAVGAGGLLLVDLYLRSRRQP